MVWVRRTHIIIAVAPDAGDGSTDKLVFAGSAMAILARNLGVDADKWKSCRLMLLNHVGDFPRLRRMTSDTVGTQLGFVDIGVTGRAAIARACEFEIFMAAGTRQVFVLAIEHEARLRVVKLCVRTHFPRICRVTRFARNMDVTVRRLLRTTDRSKDNAKYQKCRKLPRHKTTRRWC